MIASTKWTPITRLKSEDREYDFSEVDSLHEQWLEAKVRVESSSPKAYDSFSDRLRRSWAIETGIIEGLYTLDRGITETLVETGIVAEHIEPSSTNIEPERLVMVLKDHEQAIRLVNQWITEGRPFSKSLIRMLHSTLTANQSSYLAMNQFGSYFNAELHKGEFKKQPNNPMRHDGSVHEYCPPEQVDSEIDNLLDWHRQCENEQVHTILTAAWLHHKFSQIHPFEDGNGRVARALVAWQLIRDGFLPVVVSRDHRIRYIEALKEADQGSLTALVELFVILEKTSIMQALSADIAEREVTEKPLLIDNVIDGIVDRVKWRRQAESEQMRSVNTLAIELRGRASEFLDQTANNIANQLLEKVSVIIAPRLELGGPDHHNEHWYKAQVTETSKKTQHWINFNENRYFVKLSLNPDAQSRSPRLVFVVSLHHIGRELSGVMATTAFAEIEYYAENEDTQPIFIDCNLSPFTFGWKDDADAAVPRFLKWLDECFSIALSTWGNLM